MGPENSRVEGVTLYTLDGERIGPFLDLPEVTLAAGQEIAAAMCPAMAELHGTISIKPGKRWRCRSRKRFIKLLMSKGISRNQAGSAARAARIAGVPYGELWRNCFFWG